MIAIDDLKSLAGIDGPCLSIFQPLRDVFSQVTKTDTRLIAAVQKADALLLDRGMDAADRERFLRPILKLARNTDWSAHNGSVVVFRAPGFTQATFWPDVLDAQVRLGNEFCILPLIAGLGAQRNFWILALSINRIRLLRGTISSTSGHGVSEVELPEDLPRSLNEATGLDFPDHDLEARSAAGPSTGGMHAVRFGTGSAHETKNRHLHDFFKMIDRAIHPILTRSGHDPLILAAVPRELAIYREINTYPALLDEDIHGSGDALDDDRLHKAALLLVEAGCARTDEQSKLEMEAAAGRGLLLTDLAAIRSAAGHGQVERLLVEANVLAHGSIDTDLLNAAALEVVRNSGTIVCSAHTGVNAILRYRLPDVSTPVALSANT
jgi:hypothetical protein